MGELLTFKSEKLKTEFKTQSVRLELLLLKVLLLEEDVHCSMLVELWIVSREKIMNKT